MKKDPIIEALNRLVGGAMLEPHTCDEKQIQADKELILNTLESKTEEEWFYRWIARGKAGYAGMTMDQCAEVIWCRPGNPYKDENPWEKKK